MQVVRSRAHHIVVSGIKIISIGRALGILAIDFPAKVSIEPVTRDAGMADGPDIGRHRSHVAEGFGIVGGQVHTLAASYGKAGNGPVGPVRLGAVEAVHQLHDIFHEGRFHHPVHLKDALEGIFESSAFVVCVVVVLVHIGHHDDAGLGFSACPEAVGRLVHFSFPDPGGFVAAGSVQQVQDRVATVGLIVVCREVDNDPALRWTGYTAGLGDFFNNVFGLIFGPDGGAG